MNNERAFTEDYRRILDGEVAFRDLQACPARKGDKKPDKECKGNYDAEGNGAHYDRGPVECIDAIEAAISGLSAYEGYCVGQCFKYLWRWRVKNPDDPLMDLRKCRWFLERLITHLELQGAKANH